MDVTMQGPWTLVLVVPSGSQTRYLEEILIHRWALKDERHDGGGQSVNISLDCFRQEILSRRV